MKLFLTPEKHIDTAQGIDISLPLSPSKGALAWYCEPIKIWPVKGDGFIGKVSEGGATNFNNIQLNPHGNGTHTENVGHISKEFYSINDSLTQFHFISNLVTVKPKPFFNEDWQEQDLIIDEDVLKSVLDHKDQHEALIIRTQPNTLLKKNKNYSHTNPPYLTEGGVKYINSIGVKHLLIDLPSVDRENDHGALKAHRAFWNYPDAPILDKTITELIYVPDEISDGIYVLNLQIISLENDASPSKPILYEIKG
jgi:kynurenine formamidase